MIHLYKHQISALNYLTFNDSFMLFMEQGTGKTIPALVRALELFKAKDIESCLVVCPKAVIGSWKRDIEKFSKAEQNLLNKIQIINYDKVWRDDRYMRLWDCIILDEAHCIKNRTSRRASFLLNLSLKASYRYILTGTPIGNGQLENIWSLITFLNPYKNKRSICSAIFKNEYGCGDGSYYDWLDRYAYLDQFHKPYKYRNVDELQNVIQSYSYRVKKKDCLDLPEKLPDELVELEMKRNMVGIYKDIAKNSASLKLNFVAENPLVRLTKLRQLASGFFIDTVTGAAIEYGSEKDAWIADYLEWNDGKLVIFAEFKHSISNICRILTNLKIKWLVLDGEQKDKSIWRKFQHDESIRVIVCQYASACQGIDLFASSTIIYYEPTLRSSILEQSRDRIHRNGQHNPCSYIHLLTKNTIEEAIYNALQGFSDFNEAMFTRYLKEYQRSRR